MSAWDVAMVWLMWNVVMPAAGIAVFLIVMGLLVWWANKPKRRKP